MTITYQPSAAGISWLVLAQTLDSRTQMEEDLLRLSAENSKVQIGMTKNVSDATNADLLAQAAGQRQSAYFTIGGSIAGIATSVGTSIGSVATGTSKNEPKGTDSSIEYQKVEPESKVASERLPTTDGLARVDAENSPASASPASTSAPASAESKKTAETTISSPKLNKLFTDHGTQLSQAISSGVSSFGTLQQANYTVQQAEAKKLETLAQGLATVMNAQGQMLSAGISSCDTFFNNLEGSFTTIIQVSAVRG